MLDLFFFYFNPCSPLLLFTKGILPAPNDLPQGTTPLCLNVQSTFVQDPIHLWMAAGRKKLTHPLPRMAIPGETCKINGLFTLPPHLPLFLFYKRTWH